VLRDGTAGQVHVRVIENKRGRHVAIRQHMKSERYEGYTPKGVFLSAEEWDALIAQRKKITKLLAL
jgi:hypothetical protein